MILLYRIFIVLVTVKLSSTDEYFYYNVSGEVEKDKFEYYFMPYEGTILVELTSISGDCDLYVAQNNKKPSYEPESNCMSSATCGVDSLIIPKSFKRPVGIGIFGHPSHDVCSYNLMLYKIDDSEDIFNFDPYEDALQTEINKKLNKQNPGKFDDEEESFLWVFAKYIIAFLLEVFL